MQDDDLGRCSPLARGRSRNSALKRFAFVVLVFALLPAPLISAGAEASTVGPPDPAIVQLLDAVSPVRLRAIDERLVDFGTRNTFATDPSASHGVIAARDWIVGQFRGIARTSSGRMTVALDSYIQPKTARTPRAVTVSSVIATLRGDDPDGRTYVMSSHYDSRATDVNDTTHPAPGADDNASAVAAVLEAARIMASHHFAATILFAAYDGEEQGLWGSGHHAAILRADEVPVAGDLNSDIIGASQGHDGVPHPNEMRVFSPMLAIDQDAPSAEIARFAKTNVERYVPGFSVDLVSRADRRGRGGDQNSFQAQGFPAIRFVEASEDYDHQHQDVRVENGRQYGDLVQFEDFGYLARVTRGIMATLAALALGPARPANAFQQRPPGFAYDAPLKWDPVANAVSYEIVWRATTASEWTGAQNVGNVTSATLPNLSRDTYAFGVRAIDANGRRSAVSDCATR